jgi:hypothetical protein
VTTPVDVLQEAKRRAIEFWDDPTSATCVAVIGAADDIGRLTLPRHS